MRTDHVRKVSLQEMRKELSAISLPRSYQKLDRLIARGRNTFTVENDALEPWYIDCSFEYGNSESKSVMIDYFDNRTPF